MILGGHQVMLGLTGPYAPWTAALCAGLRQSSAVLLVRPPLA